MDIIIEEYNKENKVYDEDYEDNDSNSQVWSDQTKELLDFSQTSKENISSVRKQKTGLNKNRAFSPPISISSNPYSVTPKPSSSNLKYYNTNYLTKPVIKGKYSTFSNYYLANSKQKAKTKPKTKIKFNKKISNNKSNGKKVAISLSNKMSNETGEPSFSKNEKEIMSSTTNPMSLASRRSTDTNMDKLQLRDSHLDFLYERLFNESKLIAHKKQNLSQEFFKTSCPFSPKLNINNGSPQPQNFMKRLEEWKSKKLLKLSKSVENQKFDEKTGTPLYHPMISSVSSKFTLLTNESRRDVFENLYIQGKSSLFKIKQEQKHQREILKSNSKVRLVNPKSDEIHENVVDKALTVIFNFIKDENKIVTSNSVENLHKLPTVIADLIEPLILELNNQEETLEINEFILAGKELYKLLFVTHKHELLKFYKNISNEKNAQKTKKEDAAKLLTYKPMINATSQKIFHKTGKFSKNFFDRNKNFEEIKHKKLIMQKSRKIDKELEGCSHKPKINRNYKFGNIYYL